MQQVEMLKCPCCGEFTLHPKRKEMGYHVCVNCSTTKPVVGITTVEGTGDHTYNDIIIMDQEQAVNIAIKAAEIKGDLTKIELFDIEDPDADEHTLAQTVKDKVRTIIEDEETYEEEEDESEETQIEGIDY